MFIDIALFLENVQMFQEFGLTLLACHPKARRVRPTFSEVVLEVVP